MKQSAGGDSENKGSVAHLIGNILGIVLIAILAPIMVVNVTLIIKSYARPDEVPAVFGVAPLIVQSGSMDDGVARVIKVDDLILVRQVDPDTLKAGDIVAFQPVGQQVVITHRIVEVDEEGSVRKFVTQGDANNTPDSDPVYGPQIVGRYFQRFEGVGKIALYLQQPIGMVVFVAIPLALFLLYDLLRRYLYNKKNKGAQDAEAAELERLRLLAAAIERGETPDPSLLAPAAAPAYLPAEDTDDDDDFDDGDDEAPADDAPDAAVEPAAPAYPKFEGEPDDDEFGDDEA